MTDLAAAIERVRALEKKATAAPWVGAIVSPRSALDSLDGPALLWGCPPNGPKFFSMGRCPVVSENDGVLMMKARNILPALLAVVEADDALIQAVGEEPSSLERIVAASGKRYHALTEFVMAARSGT